MKCREKREIMTLPPGREKSLSGKYLNEAPFGKENCGPENLV